MNSIILTSEIATSTIASSAISSSVDASPLLTALITLGVSLTTMVGGEIVKYLVAYFKKKREDLEKTDKSEKGEK